MEGVSEEAPLVGDDVAVVISEVDLESSNTRRSLRKSSRGRLAKSRPKSPLMRMAEIRKAGLRGRALRHSGKKGFDGPGIKASKGKKGNEGTGSRVLAVIPENFEVRDGFLEGLEEEGSAGVEVAVMVEDRSMGDVEVTPVMGSPVRRTEEFCSNQDWGKDPISSGVIADCALDLVVAQPLQKMSFVTEQVTPAEVEENSGRPFVVEPVKLAGKEGGETINGFIPEEAET